MNPNSIYQMFKRRAADMDISERHNPHAVRHLVGVSAVAQLGIREAQLLLGHEDINSTLVYAGVDDSRVREITDKLRILT
jgi:site-specific recombinase XerD